MVLEAAVNGHARLRYSARRIWRRNAPAAQSAQEDIMMTGSKTYPLRLPRSVKAAVEVLAEQEGVSVN